MISLFSVFFSAAIISLLITFPLLWLLRFLKLGQPVRDDIPSAHLGKAGTPTMGGIGIIVTVSLMLLILIDLELAPQYLALLALILGYALIGLADDLSKVMKGENLGLTFWQKIYLQTFLAALFALYLTFLGQNLHHSGILANLNPYLYQLLVIFIIVGASNAANLTDGLNGLLAGTSLIAFLAFGLIAYRLQAGPAAVFAFSTAGAVLGFTYFNFPKAKLFMGDVGSLSLGAALGGIAVIMGKELLLPVIGGIFVVEALSVILQVSSFKLFARRIFRMAPLHHHFEVLGAHETSIVLGFWAAGMLLALLGVLL